MLIFFQCYWVLEIYRLFTKDDTVYCIIFAVYRSLLFKIREMFSNLALKMFNTNVYNNWIYVLNMLNILMKNMQCCMLFKGKLLCLNIRFMAEIKDGRFSNLDFLHLLSVVYAFKRKSFWRRKRILRGSVFKDFIFSKFCQISLNAFLASKKFNRLIFCFKKGYVL